MRSAFAPLGWGKPRSNRSAESKPSLTRSDAKNAAMMTVKKSGLDALFLL
jgi:hypothetical protein